MEQRDYVRRLLDVYRATPGTCGAVRRADRALAVQLYERGVSLEAVENALRHSGASSVSVHLVGTAMSLQLEVADNGVGITDSPTSRTGHLGILGMQERAHATGATVTISPGALQGTHIDFSWQSAP